jgi:glycolate oxidase iron-sulfur subunit
VAYGELLPLFRAHANGQRQRDLLERAAHALVHETLPYPGRFRLAAASGKVGRLVRGALPAPFQAMLDLLPETLPSAPALPELYPVQGPRRARVALLTGCVQQALQPAINWATLRVLSRNGVEVVIPRGQGCCGSLGLHTGELARARGLARQNLRVFPADVDAVVTNAAGCGSGMKEYAVLFAGQPEAEQAHAFAGRVRDVSEFLDALGLLAPPGLPAPLRVAYHDACHLAHAQGLQAAPRRLLAAVGDLTVVEVPEGEMCCGSAGTYNLEQPVLADQFGARKARHILGTGAQAVVTGNIGCLIQIRTHLARQGQALPVYHTLELLDQAYGGHL